MVVIIYCVTVINIIFVNDHLTSGQKSLKNNYSRTSNDSCILAEKSQRPLFIQYNANIGNKQS